MTTLVNVYEAKSRLSALLNEVEAGASVVIARAGRPIARLIPYEPERRAPRTPGSLAGKIWMAPDFDDVDIEITDEFLNS
jgi:prevent-host-death family protein